MELESLKRQMKYLEDNNVCVTKLVTDRHTQVTAYMANEKPHIEHSYDVWHLAKGRIAFTVHCFYYYYLHTEISNYTNSLGAKSF